MSEAVDLASTLRREYETARIEEVNDAPVVTRVDSAVPPQRPQWPRPAPLAVLALSAGLVIGVLTAAVAALLADWAARNPDEATELRRLLGRGRRREEPLAPPGRAAADAVPIGTVAPPAVSGSATRGGSLDLG
jgi:hypothetical protein